MSQKSCSFLNGASSELLFQNRVVQGTTFESTFHPARHCQDCGRIFFDVPNEDVLSRYYNSAYVTEGAQSWYNVEADYAPAKVTGRTDQVVDIAARFGFDNTHVFHEIGCAFGGTVFELNRRGYAATGTDLSQPAIDDGRARGNTNVFAEPDVAFLSGRSLRPHVVYGYHVLEHMPDPIGFLRSLSPLLAPDAIVILFVPNAMALLPWTYGFDRYPWFYYPAHLNMLSPGSLTCFARACGYELLDLWTATPDLDAGRTDRATLGHDANEVSRLMRDRMMQTALLQEELGFVLTPANSTVAAAFPDRISSAGQRSDSNRPFERELVRTARTSGLCRYDLPNPPEQAGPVKASKLTKVQQSMPAGGGGLDTLSTSARDELLRLRQENRQLRTERDALSRATAWLAQERGVEISGLAPRDAVAESSGHPVAPDLTSKHITPSE
ncbi:MAG: methyltransferase domain-containing protein [Acetobacteraceae bacterium]